MARIAIAGAGVLGRLLAWRLSRDGHAVSVFDPAPGPQPPAIGQLVPGAPHAAGFTAAGMLSPLAELDNADASIARLGWRSLALWRRLAATLNRHTATPLLRLNDSLLLAHGTDRGAAQRVLSRLDALPEAPRAEALNTAQLNALEPALASGLLGWRLPGEGQVLPRELLHTLATFAPGVKWHWGQHVASVAPGQLVDERGGTHRVDLAIDARGLGARSELALRGVRGEVVWLHAPGVPLARPIRLLHPRHRVYLVPRPGGRIVVGASEIESEDRSPPSLRSVVELLSAAHSVLPELAEARIEHMESNLRPARMDNAPVIAYEPGLLRVNGLFRHGWLIAPALVDDAMAAAQLTSPMETSHV
ncbi:MAG: FAD-dependent oxidoreductase [Hydrogenophaga sp.]|uniref:FAD-dependent oxidoreductase n=1 Tax=Hydrogenophaga sp. TaxID=1904254 RepID=UPI001DA2A927|nr:FAD-dependent oxidoreductase [Hydrogenophaga sp.]MBX3608527.1 FAD-dependent oxidoreductase [Hydrogenophaga sp.]